MHSQPTTAASVAPGSGTASDPVGVAPRPSAPSPRLAALRAELLRAPYRLCIQKASLLTDYFERAHPGRVPRALEAAYYRAYAGALAEQVAGHPTPWWKMRANAAAVALTDSLDGPAPTRIRREMARALAHVLAHAELRLYDHELLVGNLSSQRLGAPLHPDYGGLLLAAEIDTLSSRAVNPIAVTAAQRRELEERIFPYWFRRSVLSMTPRYTARTALVDEATRGRGFVLTQIAGISHVTPDYPTVVRIGFAGIAARIRERLTVVHRQIAGAGRAAARARAHELDALEAQLIAAEAAIAFGHRWRRHLQREAARCTDAGRRDELTALAKIFSRVPEHGATTFHEALQSIVSAHAIVHQESFQHGVSFGRFDQYLWPYYERDRATGRLTRAEAVELLGCFLCKAAELLPLFFGRATDYFSGLSSASGITLGGQRHDGGDAVNELSYLILDAYDQVRLRQPNIHVRLHPGTPSSFRDRCYQVLARGGGIPALFNDLPIVDALTAAGVDDGDARDYAVVGCAEWGVPHCSFPAAGAVFVNLAYALQLALHDGRDEAEQRGPRTGDPASWGDIADVRAAFRTQLAALIADAAAGNDAIETAHARHRPTPLLSVLVGGCIETGRDVTEGGARYNPTGMQGVGLADVADSLASIETLVFHERRLTLTQLIAACDADFAGHETLHQHLARQVPSYGEDDATANEHAAWASVCFAELVATHRNPRGGRYAAGLWTMTTHQAFGRAVGALPSGRRAGDPLANGISPRLGRERLGSTAALTSAARVGPLPNGCVLNHKLHPDLAAGAHGRSLCDALVRGYFVQGGMQVQIEVQDPQVLRDAQRHPERYPDLVVRISGYSAYFNDLTEEMKDELIARTAHGSAETCCA